MADKGPAGSSISPSCAPREASISDSFEQGEGFDQGHNSNFDSSNEQDIEEHVLLCAKDLQRTSLSEHIQRRLFSKLETERQFRAQFQKKRYDQVPGAEGLIVRVVSSVERKLKVKPQFFEIFREQNYPAEFPYRSKLILLFQKIDGVDICLFGMYVHEFGPECPLPNQRRVYLSCLDSVKYLIPEVETADGQPLRTYVYHEILIGYLEYCKLRGFTSCYIWVRPPLEVGNYIFPTHPEVQKFPETHKLRKWFMSMLEKATMEHIVVGNVNLYDFFFVRTRESRAEVTATGLPYFDGDFWPGVAEDLISQMTQKIGSRNCKKGRTEKTVTDQALNASDHSDLSGTALIDVLLMNKLGETIKLMKKEFIMVHLQQYCNHCHTLMISGFRWVCNECKKLQLCHDCFQAEVKREAREKHPISKKQKHTIYNMIEIFPMDTHDEDEILESSFFDTREAFLQFCRVSHSEFDTLAHAKHASLVLLHSLLGPTCDIKTNHSHRLMNCPTFPDFEALYNEAREQASELRQELALLVHASQCPSCDQIQSCRKMCLRLQHQMTCSTGVRGHCCVCTDLWDILKLHSLACKQSECRILGCSLIRDMEESLAKVLQVAYTQRRTAVIVKERQRKLRRKTNLIRDTEESLAKVLQVAYMQRRTAVMVKQTFFAC